MAALDLPALMPEVVAAARAAAEAILEVYESDFAVARKADASPVTLADRAAEAIILRHLNALTPGIPVIAEEQADAHGLPAVAPERFWLVDPLDGTKEFVKRNGEFTVNIGLVEHGHPVLGVVGVPAQGLLYLGCGPGTARRIDPTGASHPIGARHCPPEGAVVVYSRSHADAGTIDAFLAERRITEHLVAGSALKFCLVAEGRADLYPRLGTTMEWDTAAGQAVLEAAGGHVEQLDGSPFTYGKPGFRNGHFLARGR